MNIGNSSSCSASENSIGTFSGSGKESNIERYQISQISQLVESYVFSRIGHYVFRSPLAFVATHNDDGTVLLSNEKAKLYGLGNNLAEAKADLEDELEYAWQEFVLGDDSVFDGSARCYKRWLLDNVTRNDTP